jgi:putative membrane protein
MRPLPHSILILLSVLTLATGAAALPLAPSGSSAESKWPAQIPHQRCGVTLIHDAQNLSDGEIAYLYLQANLFEVDKAELARGQGTAPEVKHHGDEVAKDHRGVVKMFEELLLKTGIKPITAADSALRVAEQAKVMSELKQKTGADFDRTYIAHEVANHRAVIKAIRETFLPATKYEQLAAHFRDVLPAFEHHLAMTVEAARSLGVSTEN